MNVRQILATATLTIGTAATAQLQPPSGYAMQFNGTNAFVSVPNNAAFNLTQTATIELWIKPTSPRRGRMIYKGDGFDGGSDQSFGIQVGDTADLEAAFFLNNGTYRFVNTGSSWAPVGQWTHIAATVDARTGITLYLNGALFRSNRYDAPSVALRNSSQRVTIGGDPNWSGWLFSGLVDEVRLWNVVRTPEEIASSFNTVVPPNSPGLVAYYKFDEGGGPTMFDGTANGLNGTLNGSASWVAIAPACPAVTQQPTSQTLCAGSTFSVQAAFSGTTPSLQWRRNGQPIAGATSATLTIASPTPADAGSYDCVATNACGTATTNAATLTVQTPPAITGQPQAQPLVPGATATFTVATSGSNLSFQWRRNGSLLTSGGRISGATSSTLTITSVASADQGSYDCIVTGPCGVAGSATAPLTCAPIVTQQPQGGSYTGGTTITLTTGVTTAGTSTYRWRKNGANIFNSQTYAGVSTPTLTIRANDPNDSGAYTLATTNACGTAISDPAVIDVSCLSDFNLDGGVDGEDLFAFFGVWEQGQPDADVNQDGGVDFGDVTTFFVKWETGC